MFKIFFCLLNWKRESIVYLIERCCWCLLETKMMLFTWYRNIVVDTKMLWLFTWYQGFCCCLPDTKTMLLFNLYQGFWCCCLLDSKVVLLFTWYQRVVYWYQGVVVYLIPRCCYCLFDTKMLLLLLFTWSFCG